MAVSVGISRRLIVISVGAIVLICPSPLLAQGVGLASWTNGTGANPNFSSAESGFVSSAQPAPESTKKLETTNEHQLLLALLEQERILLLDFGKDYYQVQEVRARISVVREQIARKRADEEGRRRSSGAPQSAEVARSRQRNPNSSSSIVQAALVEKPKSHAASPVVARGVDSQGVIFISSDFLPDGEDVPSGQKPSQPQVFASANLSADRPLENRNSEPIGPPKALQTSLPSPAPDIQAVKARAIPDDESKPAEMAAPSLPASPFDFAKPWLGAPPTGIPREQISLADPKKFELPSLRLQESTPMPSATSIALTEELKPAADSSEDTTRMPARLPRIHGAELAIGILVGLLVQCVFALLLIRTYAKLASRNGIEVIYSSLALPRITSSPVSPRSHPCLEVDKPR